MHEIVGSLWGKTGENGRIHPLICHMMDTAQVVLAMWESSVSSGQKASFARRVGMGATDAARLLAFWAGLHDLGKAGPAFQSRCEAARLRLVAEGFQFRNSNSYTPEPHGLVTAWALESLAESVSSDSRTPAPVARALAGHHGTWPDDLTLDRNSRTANLGTSEWESARVALAKRLAALLSVEVCRLADNSADLNALLASLSGLVSAADWVASMEDRFPCAGSDIDLEEYWGTSRETARRVVRELGWTGWQPDGSVLDFAEVFSFPPNVMQSEVFAAASEAPLPAMAIVESPTGGGKTEAAFVLADRWLQRSAGRGIYFAMPTQATSNQMFRRVGRTYLARRYPGQLINLQLAHGQAMLSGELSKMILRQPDQTGDAGLSACSWFLPRKRTLLAHFGVGTVDQSFLAVLQARHFFVRLFGLANKVVVFDEVHAYDAYMNEVFCLLLRWLRALDTSVILLSATLPSAARTRLIQAYAGDDELRPSETCYPRLSVVSEGRCKTVQLKAEAGRTIRLHMVGCEPPALIDWLRQRMTSGGNAAIICNTVRRAQEVFEAVLAAGLCPAHQCRLFHARFPFYRRRRLELEVTRCYGKGPAYPQGANPGRPKCSILVATQVIEQSLDLDFDIMVTDLAPVDLLLQRAGRLHRHSNHRRALGLDEPNFAICRPTDDGAEAEFNFGGSQYVYEPYLLLRTWVELSHKESMTLPADTDSLIQAVYGDGELVCDQAMADQLLKAKERRDKHMKEAVRQALARLIPPPDCEDLLNMANVELADDEDPSVHQALSALTRLGPPGVQVVCLHSQTSDAQTITTRPEGRGTAIDPAQAPAPATLRSLLRCAVSIALPPLTGALMSLQRPAAWAKVPALRHHRLAVFTQGECRLPNSPWVLYLDETLGLSYEKEVQ